MIDILVERYLTEKEYTDIYDYLEEVNKYLIRYGYSGPWYIEKNNVTTYQYVKKKFDSVWIDDFEYTGKPFCRMSFSRKNNEWHIKWETGATINNKERIVFSSEDPIKRMPPQWAANQMANATKNYDESRR